MDKTQIAVFLKRFKDVSTDIKSCLIEHSDRGAKYELSQLREAVEDFELSELVCQIKRIGDDLEAAMHDDERAVAEDQATQIIQTIEHYEKTHPDHIV